MGAGRRHPVNLALDGEDCGCASLPHFSLAKHMPDEALSVPGRSEAERIAFGGFSHTLKRPSSLEMYSMNWFVVSCCDGVQTADDKTYGRDKMYFCGYFSVPI